MSVTTVPPQARAIARAVIREATLGLSPENALLVLVSDALLDRLISAVVAASSITVQAHGIEFRDTRPEKP